MKAFEQLERLKRMNDLIHRGRTGTPEELSGHLGISRRQLYSDLDYFRDLGMKIGYSKQRQTFFYAEDHVLEISFSIRVISEKNTRIINGGSTQNIGSVLFSCTQPGYLSHQV